MRLPKFLPVLLIFWTFCLTGIPGLLFKSQYLPPGLIQALQLQSLLTHRKQEVLQLKTRTEALRREETALLHDPRTQEREVRRVLGYAAADELIFDFE